MNFWTQEKAEMFKNNVTDHKLNMEAIIKNINMISLELKKMQGLCSQVFTPIAFITLSLMARLEYNPSSLLDMGQNHIGSPDRIMRFLQDHSAGCRLPGLRPV
ncbi:putative uncharacterized protein C5orf58 homolog isoform X1 [Panthera uncia]|nr:putative uncharacterized protein C5orf58 homolog isoform X1 [Panthera uncia]